jgi:gas vesicle protein
MAHHKKSGKGKFVIGAMLGVAAGAVAALLTAPKSGKETRDDIKDKAQEVSNDAMRQLRKLEGELNKRISDAKNFAAKLEGDARKQVDTIIARAEKTKERALKQLDGFKKDTKKQLDQGLMDDIKSVLDDLADLRERMNERRSK